MLCSTGLPIRRLRSNALVVLYILFTAIFRFHRSDTSQDKGRKRSKKGKVVVQFKSNSRERSEVLHARRKGLMQSGFKLHTMTGADVLVIVQNDRERRFYASGRLRKEYLGGKLRGTGKEEVVDDDSGAVVGPLETTPSPNTSQTNANRVSAIVGVQRSRKRLNMNSSVCGEVPEPVRKLLSNKPIPVVLDSDKGVGTQKE